MRNQILVMIVTLILSLGVQRHIIIRSPEVHVDQQGPPNLIRGAPQEEGIEETPQQPEKIPLIFRILYPWAVPRDIISGGPEIGMKKEGPPNLIRGAPEEQIVETPQQPAKIPLIFRILYPWAVPRDSVRGGPKIGIKEEGPSDVIRGAPEEQIVETPQQPAKIPLIFRILYPWAVPRDVGGAPETPMDGENMKRTEQPVEETVGGNGNVPPEPISWFIFLTRPPVWFSLAVLITFLIVKYVLRQYRLARILGRFMMFQELIGLIYLLIDIWNRRGPVFENIILPLYINEGDRYQWVVTGLWSVWSKGWVALDNTVPPVLINIVTEHRSECFLGVITMLVVLLLIYFKAFYRLRRPTSSNITPPPCDVISPSDDTIPPPSDIIIPESDVIIPPPSDIIIPESDVIIAPTSENLESTMETDFPIPRVAPSPNRLLALRRPKMRRRKPQMVPRHRMILQQKTAVIPLSEDTIPPTHDVILPANDVIIPPSSENAVSTMGETDTPVCSVAPPRASLSARISQQIKELQPSMEVGHRDTVPRNSDIIPPSDVIIPPSRKNVASAMEETALPIFRVASSRASIGPRIRQLIKELQLSMEVRHRDTDPQKSERPTEDRH